MKLAIVVQRYGPEINGGAELHARYIAEHLARHAGVEVLTTCARDYVTWRNELPVGDDTVNGVRVRRFPVSGTRDPHEFGRQSAGCSTTRIRSSDELTWLDSGGADQPRPGADVVRKTRAYDFFLFFSYRYYHGSSRRRAVPPKAFWSDSGTEPAIGLSVFGPGVRRRAGPHVQLV